MARGMPSFMALLGMLAVAGYNNRDKLAELVRYVRRYVAKSSAERTGTAPQADDRDIIDDIKDLINVFTQSGERETAETWVGNGANRTMEPESLARVLGEDQVGELSELTGLSREDLLRRLTADLPRAVDDFSPDGQLARKV